ncbi:MAG: hypothetical protein JO025_10690 [Verrucomicrobia bacterium]|nr:hypothetical protein [Verrucomicrobiota bacterium]
MTDPDSNILKSAAAYLLEVARTSKGGRYRKSAKIEALRECKDEILVAHRSGISIHRIAQIFRERNVDISTQHLMRAIRLFIAEEEKGVEKTSAGKEGPIVSGEGKRRSVTYEPSKQASPVVREEEFAKQLRIARYLAGASAPAVRKLEPAVQPQRRKSAKAIPKTRTGAKKEAPRQKAAEVELARERRRAGRMAQKQTSLGRPRSQNRRASPER